MKILSKNVILLDNDYETGNEFAEGLRKGSSLEWQCLLCVSNKSRKNKFYNIIRYFKYFFFSLRVFFKRKKIDILIGWQAFYAVLFAYYCRLFHVKKKTIVIVKNFIYKPKKGLIGKIYFSFMKKTAASKYIDKLIVSSPSYAEYCSKELGVSIDKFVPLKFGVKDYTNSINNSLEMPFDDFVFAIGRSNRDWPFLIDALKDSRYNLVIASDTYDGDMNNLPSNIIVSKDITVANNVSYTYFKNCKCVLVPILDGNIVAGETVVLTALSFSKPVIVTKPSSLSFYIKDNYDGLVINKDKESLLNSLDYLYNDDLKYQELSNNSRKEYESEYSLVKYGEVIGKIIGQLIEVKE